LELCEFLLGNPADQPEASGGHSTGARPEMPRRTIWTQLYRQQRNINCGDLLPQTSMANLGAQVLQALGERSQRLKFPNSSVPLLGTISIVYRVLS
jgi:hypothetical protein